MEGLLPLLHLGSVSKLGSWAVVPFRGTFDHTLDAKNRLTVPVRYRAALAEGVVLAIPVDQKPCVGVWRPQDYERTCERALAQLPPLSGKLNELERFFYGNSHEAELDAAGRIMVSARLIAHAGLAKDVVVVGVGNRLEMWDRGRWNEHRPALLGAIADITARVDEPA